MASSNSRNWLDLPKDLTVSILRRLDAVEILEAVQWVCMTWHDMCKNPSMWHSIEFGELERSPEVNRMGIMCRNAVDRSCGQLNHISIHYFATDELLHYIAHRAPQLLSLRLVSCNLLSEIGLKEVAKRLSNLEELHMFVTEVPKEVLISFGCCCPQLKSLTCDKLDKNAQTIGQSLQIDDKHAQAIAQTMPGLRHLSLVGNLLTNDGLQAILNNCPCLESLDLRHCPNVNLGGAFGRACAERIKNLKCPNDSIEGYKYLCPTLSWAMDYEIPTDSDDETPIDSDDETPIDFPEINFDFPGKNILCEKLSRMFDKYREP